MTCRAFTACLSAYFAETLSAPERAEFEKHLVRCSDCAVYLKSYRQTVTLGKSAFPRLDSVPADVPEDLVQAILAVRAARE